MNDITVDHAAFARELETDLVSYPEERGEILLESAQQWYLAGDHERAVQRLTEVMSLGGEDGAFARASMASFLFEAGRDDEAREHLEALKRDPGATALVYANVGELFEERGDDKEALTWFAAGCAKISEEDLARYGETGYSEGSEALHGRLRVRQAMGFAPDDFDEMVLDAPFPDFDDESDDDFDDPALHEMTLPFWSRDELVRAREVWPEPVEEDAIFREQESMNRQLSANGISRIKMVPLSVAGLTELAAATGGDPADAETHDAYLTKVIREGGTVPWPPPRNGPCWCGSGTKYKKCCGRPETA
ncbi:SEC-C metal-binding domain-containing protein [Amycolatopsis sp. CA-230715]|uniref:SEC-C metal-binding domain-containing protein n=1 Tax=Amycolatopsis sp. CA-230715 TaxID=2745196 RepID=UPI001C0285CD|nr:SEC-C metal-binding domain-containing protein [Amycolatopsis sp. CA-230715]QWF82412.1 hypothetical protein HUW46_05849 [Amycolatopsis sp. CA-230715]